MKSLKESTKLFNILCAVVMAVLLVLEFTPYWHYGEGEEAASASMSKSAMRELRMVGTLYWIMATATPAASSTVPTRTGLR